MIVGTGIDVIEVPRVAEALSRFGDRFRTRVFTAEEIAYCDSKRYPAQRFAARFAAKEAAMKAIGTGLRHGVSWQDFQVTREKSGRPLMVLRGKAAEFAAKLAVKRISLSITHTSEMAMAQVILEDHG